MCDKVYSFQEDFFILIRDIQYYSQTLKENQGLLKHCMYGFPILCQTISLKRVEVYVFSLLPTLYPVADNLPGMAHLTMINTLKVLTILMMILIMRHQSHLVSSDS